MKAIVLNASPRKNWNTAQLLKAAQKGAEDAGAETEYIDLYDLSFTGCRSCLLCKRQIKRECPGALGLHGEVRADEALLYGDARWRDRRVMAAQDSNTAGIGSRLRDPFQRFQLPLPRKAEAGRDALLPVAGRVCRIGGQKKKATAAANKDRRLSVGVAGDIDQLDALIPKQVDGPAVRPQR